MGVNLIFRIAAVGILVSVICQVLRHSGREEQAFLTSLAGLVLVLFWLVPYIYELFETMKNLICIVGDGMTVVTVGIIGIMTVLIGSPAKKPERRVWPVSGAGSSLCHFFLWDAAAERNSGGSAENPGYDPYQSGLSEYAAENDRHHLYRGICFRNLQGCRVRGIGHPD